MIDLNELRQKQFKLGHDGFVRFVDVMGDDAAIVQAARVSYGAGTKSVSDDRGLIRYLIRNQHTTPFEMCEVKLHVRVPMDTWRQWIRHRTASVNEYSTRYSEAIDAHNSVKPDEWRAQSKNNKQGSSGAITGFPEGYTTHERYGKFYKVLPPGLCADEHDSDCTWPCIYEDSEPPTAGDYLTARDDEFHRRARELYEERLKFGVAREQARKDLPLSTYTEAYWKMDLHNLMHFLKLRMDSHAQQEIREYATVIGEEIVSQLFPVTWEAFEDYMFNSMQLSRMEIELLSEILLRMRSKASLSELGTPFWDTLHMPLGWSKREESEFLAKVRALDLVFENSQDQAGA